MIMEASSPLAAMRPPTMPGAWGQNHERSSYDPHFLGPNGFQGSGFNFRELSMFRPAPDYFSCKPARESSPTSSLAVDLSRNFHIDQSPQFPTPRRSLIEVFQVGSKTRTLDLFNGHRRGSGSQVAEACLTPPLPASSPALDSDMIDVSPLPHKPPQAVLLPMIACLPTPEATPAVLELQSPFAPDLVRSQSQPGGLNSPRQKKPLGFRPMLKKGLSTNNVVVRPRSAQNNAFMFGPPLPLLNKSALESFAESPPSERKMPLSATIPSFSGSPWGATPLLPNGSPSMNIPRRPVGLGERPSRQSYRRSQSMQVSNAAKPVRQEKRFRISGSLQPTISLDDSYSLCLPYFKAAEDTDGGLPRISKDTLARVLDGDFNDQLGECAIIDCRFEYEYEGGHINSAVNFNDKEVLAKQLFDGSSLGKKTLIFHCEYSAHRAPIMAKFIRERDRTLNKDNYPRLTYPEVYILDGGYSGFFETHALRCYPQNYVEMDSKEHEHACEKGMAKVKQRPRAKLHRAQTYAYGATATACAQQKSAQINENKKPMVSIQMDGVAANLEFMDIDIDLAQPVQMQTASSAYLYRNANNNRVSSIVGARRLDSY